MSEMQDKVAVKAALTKLKDRVSSLEEENKELREELKVIARILDAMTKEDEAEEVVIPKPTPPTKSTTTRK
jgi:regulator of replication initiation timing